MEEERGSGTSKETPGSAIILREKRYCQTRTIEGRLAHDLGNARLEYNPREKG